MVEVEAEIEDLTSAGSLFATIIAKVIGFRTGAQQIGSFPR
jgi:hypothetical protein